MIEIMVTFLIITILLGLLLPALALVRDRSRIAMAQGQVAEIHAALQTYAAEDRRHRFPPQTAAADRRLLWGPEAGSTGNLNLLTAIGSSINLELLDRSGSSPYVLMDPWGHPLQYQADNDVLASSGPQRPLALDGWNTRGTRPWGYVWSVGKNRSSDGTGWIYPRDDL